MLVKIKEKKIRASFFFLQNETGSDLTDFFFFGGGASAITLSIWRTTEPVRMSLRTIKVPQCVSDIKLRLCAADLSLAAS